MAELKLDLSATFGYPLMLEFTGWHQGLSWIYHNQAERHLNGYNEDKGLSLAFLTHLPESQAWRACIPQPLLNKLLAFEKSYKHHTFSSMWFISRERAAEQLFLSEPRLFWVLMDYAKRHDWSQDDVLKTLPLKRTAILAQIGLPASKSFLNLLNRFHYALPFDERAVDMTVNLFKTIPARKLAMLQYIDEALARWLLREPEIIHYPFIRQLAGQDVPALRRTYRDVIGLAHAYHGPIETRLGQCREPAQLHELHDQLMDRFNQQAAHNFVNHHYDEAPIEPIDGIEYIADRQQLVDEGKVMRHCIGSYHHRIMDGDYCAYRIMTPQRATLGLTRRHGQWVLEQIRGERNATVSEAVQALVDVWLLNYRRSLA